MKRNTHRCPWCGSTVEPLGLRTQMMKKCCNCGNKYTYYEDGFVGRIYHILWILTCGCTLLVIVNVWIATIAVCLLMSLTFSTYSFMPYDRVDDDKRFMNKKYKATFRFGEFDKHFSANRCKFMLQDKSIMPICFFNDDNIAVSNMICVCVEDSHKPINSEFECIISFLPLSNVTYEINKNNIRFYFYVDYKLAGEGILVQEV